MSYLRALEDNFEIFREKMAMGKNCENRGAIRKISVNFQSENCFELTKFRITKFLSSDFNYRSLNFSPIKSTPSPFPLSYCKHEYFHLSSAELVRG